MTGFESPNHTQVPNDLFDLMLPSMREAELKVVLHAIRQTLGFHRGTDAISISQFQKATGLSRQGVLDGLEKAIKRGVIAEVGKGKRGVKVFRLVNAVDQSKELTGTIQGSRPVKPVTSQRSRHTKEIVHKETGNKKRTPRISHDYDSVPKQDRLEIIRAWSDNLSAPPIGAYKSDRNHSVAAEIFRAGYRAPQVALFVKAKKMDGWWKDKTLSLAKVAELMPEWLLSQTPVVTRAKASEPELVADDWGVDSFLRSVNTGTKS